ncbi:MAG: GNAT family N-acetyltransferase [Acidimicrobiales bacterium]
MSTIRRATRADTRRVCLTAALAFREDPVMRWLVPDDDVWDASGHEFFRGGMTGWLDHQEVWCTDDGVAVAAWIPPGRPESTSEPDPPLPPPDPDLAKRFGTLAPILAANTPREPHWYLQMLATHPDWQRQGLGADLMAVMFERADSEGLSCYLETETPENVAYYRHYGFEVRTEWDVPPDGPHMWGMLRPPS